LEENSDLELQAMPLFLSHLLPAGVIGLVGAAMLAAFMSTHDSYLLCWASVLAYDVAGPTWKLTDRKALLLTRILIVAIGGFLLVWSLWFPLGQHLWDYMLVTGAIYFTGAFPVVVGGLYWKRASRVGAYLALTAGAGSILGLSVIQEKLGLTPDNLGFELSSDVVGLSTAVAAVLLMLVGSLLFPDPPDSGEPA
jgi:SSS family solute:Na+ symporter